MSRLPATIDPDTEMGMHPQLICVGEALIQMTPPIGTSLEETRHLEVHAAGAEMNVAVGAAALGIGCAFPAWWPLAPAAVLIALVGFLAIMPSGTLRLHPGPPAALAALTIFGAGYFGANSLVTLLLTTTFDATLLQAGITLSASPVCWALAALLAPKLGARGAPPAYGLGAAACGVAMIAVLGLVGGPWVGATLAWAATGAGVGLAYPGLYLRATTAGGTLTATTLATAAVMTEDFGGLVASSIGAALPAVSEQYDLGPVTKVA